MKIQLIAPALLAFAVSLSAAAQQVPVKKTANGIIGADISFLPELEAKDTKFYEKGVPKDAILLLRDRGFNYIRLRIFNNPAGAKGYSPGKGYCDLAHTKAMAQRVKAAGMKLLLDFHYSDTWADPGKQFKPEAWVALGTEALADSVRAFTSKVIDELKSQGTLPDMVQVGNEINHGMLWPTGKFRNVDSLAILIKAGIAGVRAVSKKVPIMLHVASGGNNKESRDFLDKMIARGAKFEVIGQSYYPEWHGSLTDLENNLTDLTNRYKQDVIVVEYSQKKRDVNAIAFGLPGKKMKGSFIWEPLSWGETVFDKSGMPNALLELYPEIRKTYLKR